MHAYVVIASKSGGPADPLLLQRVALEDHPLLAFVPDDFVVWSHPSRAIHFVGWQAFTEMYEIGSHWHIHETGLTAFAGYTWPRESGWDWGRGSWASQLAQFLSSHDPRDAKEDLFGIYSIVTIPEKDKGFIVTDLISSGVVYVADAGHSLIFSSSAALCAAAITPFGQNPERDVIGAGWVPLAGLALVDDTGFVGVKSIPFDSFVTLDPESGSRVDKPARPYWQSDALEEFSSNIDALGQHLEQELRASIRTIASLPAPVRQMRLSGGRDSRLVASLILHEGLQDKFQFFSFGLDHTPDVVVARGLARQFDLPWVFDEREDASEREFENPMRIHTFQVGGAKTGWDMKGNVRVSPDVTLSGNFSELFRIGPRSASTLITESPVEARDALISTRLFDTPQLMRPEARAFYDHRLAEWIDCVIEDGLDFRRIGLVYMASQALRGRYGGPALINSRIWMYPLYTPTSARVVHYLPAERRQNERFHFDIIHRFSEDLAKHPFVVKPWNPETYAHLPNADEYAALPVVTHQGPGPVHWRTVHFESHLPVFKQYLLDPSNPVYAILDIERVRALIDIANVDGARLRHFYAALSTAIWLGGHELPARMNRTGELAIGMEGRSAGTGPRLNLDNAVKAYAEAARFSNRVAGRRGGTSAGSSNEISSQRSLLLVVRNFPGVSQTFIADKFLHLLARGWDVNVLALTNGNETWEHFPEIASQRLLRERVHYSSDLPATMELLMPRIVHFEFGDLALDRLIDCRTASAQTIVSFRGYDICYQGIEDRNYYDEVWEHATVIHARSTDIWSRAIERGCSPSKPHRVIVGAVDDSFFDPGDRVHGERAGTVDRPLQILTVGRLVWKKGHEYSLKAVRLLLDRGVHCELTIIGEGRHRDAIAFEARDLEIESHVQLKGAQDRGVIRSSMLEADVFLLSSLSEGFGVAVVEAQSMQLPVVCTDAEGLRENILDGASGFIVPRRDANAIAGKLEMLANDPELRTTMGISGRERVSACFRIDQEIDAFEALYRDTLDLPLLASGAYQALQASGGPPEEGDLFAYLRLEQEFSDRALAGLL